jgi:hypothetical protein
MLAQRAQEPRRGADVPWNALLRPDRLSRRLGSCHVEGGADRRALPLDAWSSRQAIGSLVAALWPKADAPHRASAGLDPKALAREDRCG